MARSKRTRRQVDVTKSQLSTATDRDTAAWPLDDIDIDAGRGSRDTDRGHIKASDSQDHRPWTPEPEPYDAEKYKAWGRKHYGEDWYEQRETMLRERNFYDTGVNKYSDYVYVDRQKVLRKMEHEREQGKLPLKKGKTWEELMAWARMHYGEAWYAQREALYRDEREEREAHDPDERKKKFLKTAKRASLLKQMELEMDEGMLAEGKTWHEIMAWPAEPSNTMPSVETDGYVVSSPSANSEHSDRSGYSTYPPTPTDFRRQAMDGPQELRKRGEGNWEFLELEAVQSRLSKAQYEERKTEMAAAIRSSREDEECERRNCEEWAVISALKIGDPDQYYIKKRERERRMRDLDLRLQGWTREQIDAMDQEEAAVRERRWRELEKLLQRELEPATADGDTESMAVSQRRAPPRRQTKDIPRKTRGGRVKKNATQSQNVFCRGTRSRQPGPTSAKAPTRSRGSTRSKRVPELLGEPGTARAQQGSRRSRRLARKSPEFGMLPGSGETPSLYQPSLRHPSDARSGLSKPTVIKGAKPPRISKSRQAGTGRPKRSVKGWRG